MANAKRDDNYIPTLLAVSNADGTTPVVLWADPTTHRLLVDASGGGATVALDNLSSVAINTTLVSDTDNTDALGTSAIAWSDLYLGSGGTIVFNSAPSTADVTITHSANNLAFTGATNYSFDAVVTGITPTASTHLATKEYVDSAVGVAIDYFFNNTASDIGGIYYDMTDSDLGGGESTLSTAGLAASTNNQALVNFATDKTGGEGILSIPAGIMDVHFHAARTAGASSVNIYAAIYKRASGGTETLIATTETSPAVTTKTSFTLHASTSVDTDLLATDRIVVKFFANVGAGAGATVALYQEGTTTAHLTISTSTNILSQIFVRQDGTKPLTANWDAGTFKITANQLESDVATGTAPFVVASTTEVANLNAATAGSATSATTATNLAGGAGGTVPYQSAAGTTAMLANGSAGQYLQSNGTTLAPTWETIAAGGDVSKVGTPVDSQIGVWTGDGTIEGAASLTYDGSNLQLTGDIGATGTRITKGWFADLEVTNAIAGSITGNAATVSTITGLAPDTATTQATQASITTCANLVTVGALDSGSITSNFGTINNGASSITTTGDITGGGILVTGDTTAGDSAALGYTATEGLILTGQGSTNDITFKNDADATVFGIPTGTTNIQVGAEDVATKILLENETTIQLDDAGIDADGDHSGITFVGNAGETVAFGDVLYLKAADSEWYLCDASAVGTAGSVAVAIAVSSGTDGNPVTLMQMGIIQANAGFPALTVGAPVYISETGTTTNTVTVTAPTTADAVVRVVGFALTADKIMFNPSPSHITVTG